MNKRNMFFYLFALFIMSVSCANNGTPEVINQIEPPVIENLSIPETKIDFYYGADLSYVNEMIDCGAKYIDSDMIVKDPYVIFSEAGTNLVRVRLWHNPEWTEYSDFEDVKKTILRAKEEGMQVMLDFHYSDTWTDPSKQKIPAAWESYINDKEKLGSLLYDYTYKTLIDLADAQLLPEIVQVGNEINPMILQGEDLVWPINWDRNSFLINKGIKAVRDVSKELDQEIGVMLHIAQPENALWWFKEASENGITDYDWIGLSYYPIWSEYNLENVGGVFKSLIDTYKKRLMVVETAYPFTMENADGANNILDNEALVSGYPASQQGQLDYLNQLKKSIQEAGGEGLVYWEPGWVSTDCNTLWGQGSHWDNATLFDHENKATKGMEFYKPEFD
jgi:arabinogalactan endo-1,4-beta-galactosidase